MRPANPLEKNNNPYDVMHRQNARSVTFPISHDVAISAQQFGGNTLAEDVNGRDGISKTTVWRNYACTEELRTCENVPDSACRCQLEVRE
jgi:hypothetical protein